MSPLRLGTHDLLMIFGRKHHFWTEHSQNRHKILINRQNRHFYGGYSVGPKWLALIRSARFLGPRSNLIGRPRLWVGAKIGPNTYLHVIGWEVHPRGKSSKTVVSLGPRAHNKKFVDRDRVDLVAVVCVRLCCCSCVVLVVIIVVLFSLLFSLCCIFCVVLVVVIAFCLCGCCCRCCILFVLWLLLLLHYLCVFDVVFALSLCCYRCCCCCMLFVLLFLLLFLSLLHFVCVVDVLVTVAFYLCCCAPLALPLRSLALMLLSRSMLAAADCRYCCCSLLLSHAGCCCCDMLAAAAICWLLSPDQSEPWDEVTKSLPHP